MHGIRAVIQLAAVLAGPVAAFLPTRYWPRLERCGIAVAHAAGLSALFTAGMGGAVGLRGFLAHAIAGAAAANNLLVRVAATQVVPSTSSDVTSSLSQAISASSALAFVITPTGAIAVYLTCSGSLRLLGAYLGEPFGDPLLIVTDSVCRRILRAVAQCYEAAQRRRAFGPIAPDSIVGGAEVDVPDAEVVVIACRPKAGWSPGAMLVSTDGCYLLGTPLQRRMGRRERILYPLVRKRDAAIVRRWIRYDLS